MIPTIGNRPELIVRWLDGPPKRVYEKIAKATLNCHSENPIEDMKKVDSNEPVIMFEKGFADGHEMSIFLTKYVRDLGHHAMLEFSGQFNFLVTGCSRGLTHEQVRQRVGVSYAQRSTRFVSKGDYIIPHQLSDEDRIVYQSSLDALSCGREVLEDTYPKDVTRHLLPIATHSPIVIGYNNVRSLLYDLGLRCCNRAHWEIRYMANTILKMCRKEYPDLFDKAGAHCQVHGYCKEGDKQCKELKGKVPTLNNLVKNWKFRRNENGID